jgi:vancomycin resistance protein YoaR
MYTVVRTENGDGTAKYELKTNTEPLKNFLQGLAQPLEVQPVNARFLFNDATGQLDVIQDSVDGRILNVTSTVDLFQQVMVRPTERRSPLVFNDAVAPVNTKSTAAQLGITQEIVAATTFFYGSTLERRKNIQVAASRFHGLVIEPGEVFSFNKYLGDVSPESGFETGLVIFGDRTIQGVGGGVCQVSSTVFQAAFFAGFPIKERYAHGYRVGYYESGTAVANGQRYTSGVGMDATVYSPIIDFKFVNDTPYYLLIESYYSPEKQALTFKFYSTGTGRVVAKDGPTLSNVVGHGAPKYTESKDVRPGETRQVDYAVNGVDVRVYRTVTQNGAVIVSREEFYSHYLPWSSQFLVAPGYAPRR